MEAPAPAPAPWPDPLALLEDWGSWDGAVADLGTPLAAAELGTPLALSAAAAATAPAAAALPPADPELEKRRAQNRAAMQRYRQRQRQRRVEQQQQHEELTSELQRARLEHQAVLAERRALEAQHSLRDDWMRVLRLVHEAQPTQPAHRAPSPRAASAATLPGAAGDPQAALQLAAWLESVAGSSGRAAAEGRWVPTLAGDIAASLRASPGLLATVRALTPAQLVALWDGLLAQLADLLAAVEANGCKAAERQLVSLMIESCLFLDLVTLLRPTHLKLLMAARGMAPPAPDGGMQAQWREAVAALRLTPAQRRDLVAEWHTFKARQAELAAAASAAAAGVAAAAAAPAPQCADDDQPPGGATPAAAPAAAAAAVEETEEAPAASLAALVDRYMRLAESTGELAAAGDAHWASLLAYSDAAWYKLTPLQGARLLAACRPFYPDPIQLALALEQAEAEAEVESEAAAAVSAMQASGTQPPRALLEAAGEGGGCEGGDCEGLAAAAAHCWRLESPAAEQQGASGGAPSGQLLPCILLCGTASE